MENENIGVFHENVLINKLKQNIQEAVILAKQKHIGQLYGDKPYYKAHIEKVLDMCDDLYAHLSSDEEYLKIILVGVLHDIVEDTDVTQEDINTRFPLVSRSIEAITKLSGEEYTTYLRRFETNPIARKVKIADAWCNLQASCLSMDLKKIKKYTKVIDYLKY